MTGRHVAVLEDAMLAKEIMTTKLVTAREDTPVRELAIQMLELRISAVQIVNGEGRLLGIVSESELLRLPATSGELLPQLRAAGHRPPAVMITGSSDLSVVVEAMKAGAADFIEKPVGRDELLASNDRAHDLSRDASRLSRWHQDAAERMTLLTPRQRQVMDRVLAGEPNKNIAADLGISQRTVEHHRAAVMKRMAARSLPELARLALAASWSEPRNRRVEISF